MKFGFLLFLRMEQLFYADPSPTEAFGHFNFVVIPRPVCLWECTDCFYQPATIAACSI
jgi:hypothetical protein